MGEHSLGVSLGGRDLSEDYETTSCLKTKGYTKGTVEILDFSIISSSNRGEFCISFFTEKLLFLK